MNIGTFCHIEEQLSILILFAAVIFFILSVYHYKSLLNPMGTFVSLWLIVLYLYSLKLSSLLLDLSMTTMFLVTLALVSFTVGCLFVGKRAPKPFYAQPEN